MTRILAAFVVLLAWVQVAAAEDPKPAPAPAGAETWYAERIITGSSGTGVEHLWSKGPWLRSEMVIGGQPILQLVKGDRYVIVNRIQRRGVSIQRNPQAIVKDASRRRPIGEDQEMILAAGGEAVRSEQIAGQECEVFRLTDADGRRETCVSKKEPRLPIRTSFWHRATNHTSQINYVSWASKVPLPDEFFDPDPGFVLEQLGYEQYLAGVEKGPVGPAPALHSHLLHGR
jgi:hypothetical protein